MDREEINRLKEEFEEFYRSSDILAILLFGSRVNDAAHSGSDTDICIVKGDSDRENEEILREAWRQVGGKYDI